MKIEVMIYVYIAICVSMMIYNTVYVFMLKKRAKDLTIDADDFEEKILIQIERIKNNELVDKEHKDYLAKKLIITSKISAFDRALDRIDDTKPELANKYISQIYPVFCTLIKEYMEKDEINIAYFPFILYKYNVLEYDTDDEILNILFKLLRSKYVYCRENSLKAIYTKKDAKDVIFALKIIDKNKSFHHPKLITDGLFHFTGDKDDLCHEFFENFDEFSTTMQTNVLNFFRFAGVRCDGQMLDILKDDKMNSELHFSAIRYFEKFPTEQAKPLILDLAENLKGRVWEYQSIASSALKSYPDDRTFRILVKNLSSRNWYVRLNSAISCEKLGYTYYDLINVFDGNDRYAREILRYRLEHRKTEKEKVGN